MIILHSHLPELTEGSFLLNLLEVALLCGQSLSRVGVDIRPLVVPTFEQQVIMIYTTTIQDTFQIFVNTLDTYEWFIPKLQLMKLGIPIDKHGTLLLSTWFCFTFGLFTLTFGFMAVCIIYNLS